MVERANDKRTRYRVDQLGKLIEVSRYGDAPEPESLSKLLKYAHALLRSNFDKLKFISATERSKWLLVSITADRGQFKGANIELEVEYIEPPYKLTRSRKTINPADRSAPNYNRNAATFAQPGTCRRA